MALTRYALIEDGTVREIKSHDGDIYEIMHADLTWVEAADPTVVEGWLWDDAAFSAPLSEPDIPHAKVDVLERALLDAGALTQQQIDAAAVKYSAMVEPCYAEHSSSIDLAGFCKSDMHLDHDEKNSILRLHDVS